VSDSSSGLATSDRRSLEALSERIGHRFADLSLLSRALAHRSWCAETPGEDSNERLEFLGDAVLGWAVADIAYRHFGELPEGLLTDLRKSVVNAVALAQVAQQIELGPHILLGKGEAAAGGAEKPSILSDAFEAVLAAVYLDGGAGAAFAMVERLVAPRMKRSVDRLDQLDHKTQLQELTARLGRGAPEYRLTSTGPDHAKTFTAEALVDGIVIGIGTGRSKKAAEQGAASEACETIAGEG
jgi:ribonuclease-3